VSVLFAQVDLVGRLLRRVDVGIELVGLGAEIGHLLVLAFRVEALLVGAQALSFGASRSFLRFGRLHVRVDAAHFGQVRVSAAR
jgi:hypothetical protein